jgi:hypothetical protein
MYINYLTVYNLLGEQVWGAVFYTDTLYDVQTATTTLWVFSTPHQSAVLIIVYPTTDTKIRGYMTYIKEADYATKES